MISGCPLYKERMRNQKEEKIKMEGDSYGNEEGDGQSAKEP